MIETELLLRISATAIVALLVISLATAIASNELSANHWLSPLCSDIWKWSLIACLAIIGMWIVGGILNFIWTADAKDFKNK
jgi:hypothetical protein